MGGELVRCAQAVPELVSSLSRGRLSTAEENGSEPADGSGTPSNAADAAAEGSPWEAKSPGDSPRSRMDSMLGDRRQARATLMLLTHWAVSLYFSSCPCWHGTPELSSSVACPDICRLLRITVFIP